VDPGLASWRERHGLPGGEQGQDAEIMEEAFADVRAVALGQPNLIYLTASDGDRVSATEAARSFSDVLTCSTASPPAKSLR
jgi:hypothetical protein